MRKTELNFFENGNCLAGYDYYPFYEIFKSIRFLIGIKAKNEKELRGIYYTIIIQCTTLIEGMSGQIINSSIEHRFYEVENFSEKDKEFYKRILQNLEKTVNNSFFRELEKNWEVVYDQDLKKAVNEKDSELWKSITTLFQIRNAISHGHLLTVEYHPTGNNNDFDIKVLDKYKGIYSFLTEKKLIEADRLGMVHLVNKKVVEFFIEEATKFINAIILSIPNNRDKSLAMNKYQFIREQTL
ncbi:hypothetical protein FG167_08470 [Lacinutrix sp. WUR7]|uniref:hypothetical protein n=1 Tax=Lacinutrix sp. WUR7 TaxID=2653681 RepID=UPI00193D3A99|nr:hypothetical protein [Lacinutrix sp. WUR7]QRM89264.1 hypothetical protein FG167_08470 [Lacinutrix sp. WUR7]